MRHPYNRQRISHGQVQPALNDHQDSQLLPGDTLDDIDREVRGKTRMRPDDLPGFARPSGEITLHSGNGDQITLKANGRGNSYVALEPGTAEFARRYIPPGAPIIEQYRPDGAEGFTRVPHDGITGLPIHPEK